MGNHRFKFSDMVPNAWFYMLKDMRKSLKGKTKGHNQNSFQINPKNEALLPSRPSYFFSNREEAEKPHLSPPHPRASDTLFPRESPANSKKRSRRKPNTTPHSELSNFQLRLPPITTKPKEAERSKAVTRRSPAGIHRLRLRASSPRVAAAKSRRSVSKQEKGKGISKSFAVVKSSTNPERDFRESMLEMIGENNIRTSGELEELLACYLLLNENEYHDVIIKVFERIWFDLTDMSL